MRNSAPAAQYHTSVRRERPGSRRFPLLPVRFSFSRRRSGTFSHACIVGTEITIGIARDLVCSPACPFGEISFGQRCKRQAMRRNRCPRCRTLVLPEKTSRYLSRRAARLARRRLSISIKTAVSTLFSLSLSVNHRHMNALRHSTGKGNLPRTGRAFPRLVRITSLARGCRKGSHSRRPKRAAAWG